MEIVIVFIIFLLLLIPSFISAANSYFGAVSRQMPRPLFGERAGDVSKKTRRQPLDGLREPAVDTQGFIRRSSRTSFVRVETVAGRGGGLMGILVLVLGYDGAVWG